MSSLVIEGGRRVEGRVDVEGNKNAALPLIAACLLTDEWCTLTNVPRIADVEVMARLLLDLGAEVEGIGSTTLRIRCANVTKDEPDSALVGRLRGSVLLMGPLLARRGRAIVAPPGGAITARPRRASSGPINSTEPRSRPTSVLSGSSFVTFAQRIRSVVLPMPSTSAPRSSSSRAITSTSAMRGMLVSVHHSSVNRHAATSGSAAFLLPSTSTRPSMRRPPSITNVDTRIHPDR